MASSTISWLLFSIAKSPLTGGFGESEAGGWWGHELKRAGYAGSLSSGVAEDRRLRRGLAEPGHRRPSPA